MNERDLDRMLSAWLDDPHTPPAPAYLGEVLERTRRTSQRPAWSSLERWLPMTTVLRPALPVPGRLLALGLALILALLAALAAGPFLASLDVRPAVTPPADPNGLVAWSTREGDIMVADPSAGRPRTLVGGPEHDIDPIWSPDGRHLLFWRTVDGGELPMLTDADGTAPVALTSEPVVEATSASWAPDSSAIAVASTVDGRRRISVLPVTGGDLEDLNASIARGDEEWDLPAWRPTRVPSDRSPTGEDEVLYRLIGDKLQPSALGTQRSALGSVRFSPDHSGGGLIMEIGQSAGEHQYGDYADYDFLDPAWAPNGFWFAYHDLQNLVEAAPDRNGFRVHVAAYDGGTDRIIEYDAQSDDEHGAAWSPDGTRLAFQVAEGQDSKLVIMPLALFGSPVVDGDPVVSPPFPGSAIGGGGGLGYAWSPDGSSLIVTALRSRTRDTYRMDAATGGLTPLDGWAADSWPTWQTVTE